MIPDDTALTETGLGPTGTGSGKGTGSVLLLACGALAREILALKQANGWAHLDLYCLPAILHNHPDQITPRIEQAIAEHRSVYGRIFVVYADCGTGGHLKAACDRLGVDMIEGPHCYSFFDGNARFAGRDEISAFYLTDFLVRQFDAFVWRPLGLDRHPQLRDAYFGNYTKLVHLSQTADPALTALAQTHATRLGLAFEHRHTGYGDLHTALAALPASLS